jgi:D-proline reductase (dithiol) PrdB
MHDFDGSHRIFVSYIDKSREYYLARGYGNPYRWAHHEDVPFAPLTKPLSESRVALITTASLSGEERNSMEVYAAPAAPPPSYLFTDHRSWHKQATHTGDVESFLPVRRLAEFAATGRIGSPSPRFYGVPADFSQRRTVATYAPAVLDLCRADAADLALLFPL